MIPSKNNLNVIEWHEDIDLQDHNKFWASDVRPVTVELDTIPPFQLVASYGADAITSFKLVALDTGTETDILVNATSTGLEHISVGTDYDLIIYPATVPLWITGIEVGNYYLKLSNGTTTWYSEVINMCDDVTDLIKLEYWHGEDFTYPGGKIRYDYPYKNRLYIGSVIAKPSYEYEEEVVKRDGVNLPIKQISYKLHRFFMFAPEYLVDAIRVIRMHDFVFITYKGIEYDVDELLMNSPKWEDHGDVALLEIEFKTDTVAIVNGRGLADATYEVVDGECIDVDYTALATLEEASAEYTGYYYLLDAVQVYFQTNDYVLKIQTADDKIVLEQFNGSTYDSVGSTNDEVVYDSRDDDYYFYETDTYTAPYVTSAVTVSLTTTIIGKSFLNTLVEIYFINGPTEDLVATGPSSIFGSTGLTTKTSMGAYTHIKAVAVSPACDGFEESELFLIV